MRQDREKRNRLGDMLTDDNSVYTVHMATGTSNNAYSANKLVPLYTFNFCSKSQTHNLESPSPFKSDSRTQEPTVFKPASGSKKAFNQGEVAGGLVPSMSYRGKMQFLIMLLLLLSSR